MDTDIKFFLAVVAAIFILLYRVGTWAALCRRVDAKIDQKIKVANTELYRKVAEHTLQIAGLHGQNQDNKHKILQLVWAGANSVASAAIWAKTPPRQREVDCAISDYRRIVGDDDLDHSEVT